MIASVLIWIYAGALFYLFGLSAMSAFGRWMGQSPRDGMTLPLTVVTGMAVVTTLGTVLSSFMGLGLLAALVLLAGGIVFAVAMRVRPRWAFRWPKGPEWWHAAVVLLTLLFCLENATRTPANPDTNVYHAQTIRWIETYRAVPGLGNLNGRLAYNSNWLLLNAAFSLSFLQLRSFHVMGGLLFIVAMLYFAEGVRAIVLRSFSLANWLRLTFIPMAFWVLQAQLSSPGTDLPVILLAWILLTAAIEYAAAPVENPLLAIVIAVLPAFMVTLKLSSAPFLLVSAYVLARACFRRDARLAAVVVVLNLAILVPWMIRSVILSGYVVFPYAQLDLFQVDWKVPAAYADSVRNGIIGWARLPSKNWSDAISLPYQVWLPEWFKELTLNQQVVLGIAALAPLGLLPRTGRPYAAPIGASYLAFLVWLAGAPNFRFGYGVVLGLAAFVLASLLFLVSARWLNGRRFVAAAVVPALLVGFLGFTLGTTIDFGTLRERSVLPMDYYPSRAVPCSLGNLPLYCAAVNRQCSYAAFPCLPTLPPNVRARGEQLQDGFYSLQ